MNDKIKLYIPDYYNKFKCKAGDCTDTCCTAWEIDIDEDTYKKYQEESDRLSTEDPEFAAKLKNSIIKDECFHFNLDGRTYCPFFTDEGLCEIQMKLGESALCQICGDHPRFYDYFPDRKEAGVGICCEAACELIMFKEDPVTFIEEWHEASDLLTKDMLAAAEEDEADLIEDAESSIETEEAALSAMNDFIFDARAALIEIVQNRSLSISERIRLCEKAGGYIQDMIEDALLFGDELSDPYEICEAVCGEESQEYSNYVLSSFYSKTELLKVLKDHSSTIPLREEWSTLINELNINLDEIMNIEQDFYNAKTNHELRYEQLLVYFIFRYTGKAAYDGDLYSKLKFGLDSLCIIHLTELYAIYKGIELDRTVLIRIASGYSKEIEYSEENIDMLMY